MSAAPLAHWMLEQEARALLTRLARLKPFVLNQPMVPAASFLPTAQLAIERFLAKGRSELKARIRQFIVWVNGPGRRVPAAEAQQRFVFLRLRFNAVLSQLDLFDHVLAQRGQNELGVWLSGLDAVSSDALALPDYYKAPPVVCYLDRGVGAAIRRARTRLPGGGENPVSIIRIPRERMISSGISSSLIHEVGHQGAELLGLVASLRPAICQKGARSRDPLVWNLWERWVSEVISDFWSVARLGIVSTLGLIGVVGLPRPFVFRLNVDDPHPMPWIRVKLSCAIGDALNPHPQWQRVARVWESYYPLDRLSGAQRNLILRLEESLPAFAELLAGHRPPSLKGRSLAEALEAHDRRPERLGSLFHAWRREPAQMYRAPPSLVFAAIGQAKADGYLGPEDESDLLARLLTHWAIGSTLNVVPVWTAVPGRPPETIPAI
ncbi:hypothetical protein FHX15_005274 [Rhizobium sp. BK650]|uniref:hypothetical protein n=1 Tax=Rhizobium sp. BK650 TaxID=2586990 RepID=UPI00160FB6DE|nr:hypothetical protein [Rhizobium sp. BK650]MBB3660005.1 hypothetical protein [Rhizobium sp. BK650]